MNDITELLLKELRELYDAEKQLVQALPRLAEAADAEELKTAFTDHAKETGEHVKRLERIFKAIKHSPTAVPSRPMVGLIEDVKMLLKNERGVLTDAALISAAQKVEHFEIACYSILAAWAELLGDDQVLSLLEKTLEQERQQEETLLGIAGNINLEVLDEKAIEPD